MKKTTKVMALFMILVSITTMFSGCSSSELKLFQALMKNQSSITSLEGTTDLSFKLNLTGFPEEEAKKSEELVKILNNLNLSMKQKMIRNIDSGFAKAEVKANFNIYGLPTNANLWVETGVENGLPKVKEVFQIPPFVSKFIPNGMGNKEYIVLDNSSILNQATADKANTYNFEKSMNLNKEIIDLTSKFTLAYAKNLKPDFEIVSLKGTQGKDGILSDTYQLKINDAALKKLIRFVVNDLTKNKENLQLVKEYFKSIASIAKTIEPVEKQSTDDLDIVFSAFESKAPEFIGEFNKFMDSINDITILGEKGIDITYTVNSQGYVVKETGIIDLSLDIGKIAELVSKNSKQHLTSTPTGKIDLQISSNWTIDKINEKVEINIPETTKDNSINLFDTIQSNIDMKVKPGIHDSQEGASNSITVFANNKLVNFKDSPTYVDGKLFVTAKEMIQALGGSINWDSTAQTITADVNNKNISFTIGKSEAIINGESHKMEVSPTTKDGKPYIPLRFLVEILGGEVQWIDEVSTAFVELK